jgi:hypothetical protein
VCIKKYFPNLEEKITKAIAKGRECVRERGLLTKEPCLCHGTYLVHLPYSNMTSKLTLSKRHHRQRPRPRR